MMTFIRMQAHVQRHFLDLQVVDGGGEDECMQAAAMQSATPVCGLETGLETGYRLTPDPVSTACVQVLHTWCAAAFVPGRASRETLLGRAH